MSYCSWDQSSELNIKYHDTDMGRPLYEKYGFVKMNDEM